MSEYQVRSKLLGLAHVQVVGYEMPGQGRIHVQIETIMAAAMCQRVANSVNLIEAKSLARMLYKL